MGAANLGDAVFVALCLVVPLLVIHSAISLMLLARSVKGWRPVDGILEYLHDYTITGGGASGRGVIGTGIEIEFRYSYETAEFKGKRVSIVDFPPRIWATEYRDLLPGLKAAYAEKKSVQVFVNPDSPRQAVLSMPSIRPQIRSAMFFLLLDAALVPGLFLQDMSVATWACGIGLGIAVYVLFLVGLLSTALP